jgi:hypothetical protein
MAPSALASIMGRIRFSGWDSPGLAPQTTIMSASGSSGPQLAEQQAIGKLGAENYPAAAGQFGIAIPPCTYPGRLGQAGQSQIGAELGRSGTGAPKHPANCRSAMFSGNLLELIRYEIQGLVPGNTFEFQSFRIPHSDVRIQILPTSSKLIFPIQYFRINLRRQRFVLRFIR